MSDMILVYVVCKDVIEAKDIAKNLLQKKLIACANIIDNMQSIYFWPPNSDKIEEDSETVLLVKTLKSKYEKIQKIIKEIHSYDIPCIFSIKIDNVDSSYFSWLKLQINST